MTRLLIVGLATSLDRYLTVSELHIGSISRPIDVVEQAGGKALHAARAASGLGAVVEVVALAGGPSGTAVRELAASQPWTVQWIEAATATRQCTCILDTSRQAMTELYEPLPPVHENLWAQITNAVSANLSRQPDALLLSGRIPDGLPPHGFAELTDLARTNDVPVYLDSAGAALTGAMDSPPDVVKVNEKEAAQLNGGTICDLATAIEAAQAIVARGTTAVVITRGPAGAVFADQNITLRVDAPIVSPAFPVGSGDSFFAALALSRTRGHTWTDALTLAAAAAAANAARPHAADIDVDSTEAQRGAVSVRELRV